MNLRYMVLNTFMWIFSPDKKTSDLIIYNIYLLVYLSSVCLSVTAFWSQSVCLKIHIMNFHTNIVTFTFVFKCIYILMWPSYNKKVEICYNKLGLKKLMNSWWVLSLFFPTGCEIGDTVKPSCCDSVITQHRLTGRSLRSFDRPFLFSCTHGNTR